MKARPSTKACNRWRAVPRACTLSLEGSRSRKNVTDDSAKLKQHRSRHKRPGGPPTFSILGGTAILHGNSAYCNTKHGCGVSAMHGRTCASLCSMLHVASYTLNHASCILHVACCAQVKNKVNIRSAARREGRVREPGWWWWLETSGRWRRADKRRE